MKTTLALILALALQLGDGTRTVVKTWWPDGTLKSMAHYAGDVLHGEYRTWYASGRPYELRHFDRGRESGVQQSWTADGELFLNYEVRDGRRYGYVNARPCVPVDAPQHAAPLPYYDSAELTPRWTRPAASRPFEFDLLTQRATKLTPADLRDRIHVASFIFTRCDGICPTMMKQLRRVQAEAPRDVTLVSFTVTPNLDRPADLAAFGARERVDPDRWLLVTGDESQIFGLARDFYFADDRRLRETPGAFLHTEKVMLVDRNGDVRGVYNGTVPFDMERLLEDITKLTGARP